MADCAGQDLGPTTSEGSAAQHGGMSGRQAGAAIAVGTVCAVGVAVAVRHTELLTGRPITHGVPPLPAFGVLLALSAARPLLLRLAPRLAPTRGQMLLVYCMVATSTILTGAYHVRALLPHLVSMRYLGRSGGPMAQYADALPAWLAPREPGVAVDYYDGAADRAVPWEAWLGPLGWWALFLCALFAGSFALITLVRNQWVREERLAFPLLGVPLAIAGEGWSGWGRPRQRAAIFALGFAAASAFNGVNILHVVYPSSPALGFMLPLAPYFTERPWEPLGAVTLFFMLEAIGIGYLVPLDISFSTWFIYLVTRGVSVVAAARGLDEPGFPHTQSVSAGGFVAMGLLLAWALRRAVRASVRRALDQSERGPEAVTDRRAWVTLVVCSAFVLLFMRAAGLSLWLAAPYFGVLALFLLVFARVRAETGVPFGFIYPYGMPKEMLLNAVSVPGAIGLGGTSSFVLFSAFAWMSRHHLAPEHAAYQLDAVKLGGESRTPFRWVVLALAVAFVVGLGCAFWAHLEAYYAVGSNMAGGGGAAANEWRAVLAQQEYELMAARLANPPQRSVPQLEAAGVGFLVTAGLQWARVRWVGWPFHPLGFLLATSGGDTSVMWFPMFVAWLCKAIILRAGGLSAYRQGIPFFLGLAIGHFFVAGILWPVLTLFLAPEASRSYGLFFGG